MKNVIPVRYRNADYMVVEGSDKHRFLREANEAWNDGNLDATRELFALALASPGCGFEYRTMMSSDPALGAAYLTYSDWAIQQSEASLNA